MLDLNFHKELVDLTSLIEQMSLATTEGEKKPTATEINAAFQQIPASLLQSDWTSASTFEELAEKVVAWIGSHKESLSQEDAASLEKLQKIFSTILQENDKPITALAALSKASLVSADDPHSFNSVTRNLKNCSEILKIGEDRLKRGEATDLTNIKWNEIEKVLETSDRRMFAIDALRAFHDNKITLGQFTSLIKRWSLANELPDVKVQTLSLFDANGKVNPLAENYIRQTLKVSGNHKGGPDFLDDKQIQIFFEKMKLEPESEQTFFFIKTTRFDDFSSYSRTRVERLLVNDVTITEELYQFVGFNVFNQFEHEGETYRMIPNLSMKQQFLNAYSGDGVAVKITPVIGLSSEDDILRNAETDTRDSGMPFNDVELPKEADMLTAPFFIDFDHHDFYHSVIANIIPPTFRQGFAEFAKAVLEVEKKESDLYVKNYLHEFFERIIDMEHSVFSRHLPNQMSDLITGNPSLVQKFIVSIQLQQANALNRVSFAEQKIKKKDFPDISQEGMSVFTQTYVAELLQKLVNSEAIRKLADFLLEQEFCSKYNISREDLRPFVEEIRRKLLNEFSAQGIIDQNLLYYLIKFMDKKDIIVQLFERMKE